MESVKKRYITLRERQEEKSRKKENRQCILMCLNVISSDGFDG